MMLLPRKWIETPVNESQLKVMEKLEHDFFSGTDEGKDNNKQNEFSYEV